jgi:hypothetical protein
VGEGGAGAGAEDILRLEDKVLGLPLIKTRSVFFTAFPMNFAAFVTSNF